MLPAINLDDQNFSDIVDGARQRINKYYARWTDFNVHDPGITFIELFAWLKELQQFHLDGIGPQNRLKFLKLLGFAPRSKQPARTFVRLHNVRKDQVLPQGTLMWAGALPFETDHREFLTRARIVDGFSRHGQQQISFGNQLAAGGRMRVYPFGRAPRPGDAFYIKLDRPLPTQEMLSLYVTVFDDYAVKRNPPGPDFAPLATLKWEYLTETGWQEARVEQDGTQAFIQSGRVRLQCAAEMSAADLPSSPRPGYWLRVGLECCDYDVAPTITGIGLNIVPVTQKRTLAAYRDFTWEEGVLDGRGGRTFTWEAGGAPGGSAELYVGESPDGGPVCWRLMEGVAPDKRGRGVSFTLPELRGKRWRRVRLAGYAEEFAPARRVGVGDGFPYQSFEIRAANQLAADLEIMAAVGDGRYVSWERVADFDRSAPDHRHFTFDEGTGRISFGDCERGMAPEGDILVVGSAVCAGQAGNVKEGTINAFAGGRVAADVVNDTVAAGGAEPESIEQAFLRLRRELRRVERAVTYADYEHLVRATPGLMINNCRAIPVSRMLKRDGSTDENAVSVVVQPFALEGVRQLNGAYRENIRRQLGNRRLIGTRVNILSPEYIGVELFAEITAKPYYRDAPERIRRAVEDYFGGAVWEFGRPVQYSSIYGIIDTLDCVVRVESLVIDAQGKGMARSVSGDVMLPPNGMAYLKKAEFAVTEGE